MEAAKNAIGNILGSSETDQRSTTTGTTHTGTESHHHPTASSAAGASHAPSSTAATHDNTSSSATGTKHAPTVHDITTSKGVEGSHSHPGGVHHQEGGQFHSGTGTQQYGSTQHTTGTSGQQFGGIGTQHGSTGTQQYGGTQSQTYGGTGTSQQYGSTGTTQQFGSTGTTHQHGGTHQHEGTTHGLGGTHQHEGTHLQEGSRHHEGTQLREGTQHHESGQHHDSSHHHGAHIPGLHKTSSKEAHSPSPDRANVQTPDQGPDPALVGEPAGTGSGKLTGTAQPGSHSAVFGLTPDGHRETKTSSKSTPAHPASSLGRSSGDNAERNDTSSRAPTGAGVAEQLHRPDTGPKGLERTDPAPAAAGSEPKPGAGTTNPLV